VRNLDVTTTWPILNGGPASVHATNSGGATSDHLEIKFEASVTLWRAHRWRVAVAPLHFVKTLLERFEQETAYGQTCGSRTKFFFTSAEKHEHFALSAVAKR
jgi:hypothetical protein